MQDGRCDVLEECEGSGVTVSVNGTSHDNAFCRGDHASGELALLVRRFAFRFRVALGKDLFCDFDFFDDGMGLAFSAYLFLRLGALGVLNECWVVSDFDARVGFFSVGVSDLCWVGAAIVLCFDILYRLVVPASGCA